MAGWLDDLGDGVRRAIRAYHGSPYDFDRFDASRIDTGQGAQSYGHGLYFAENEKVADSYRRMLSGSYTHASATDEDVAQYFTPGNIVDGYGGKDKVLAFHTNREEPWNWHVEVIRVGDDGLPMPGERPRAHRTTPSLAQVDRFFGRPPRRPGHTYEVEIGLPEQSLLDWDAAIPDQNMAVQGVFGNVRDQLRWPETKAKHLGGHADSASAIRWNQAVMESRPKGMDLWHALHTLNDGDGAAKFLADQGVPGIRYLDQGSRAGGRGTHNYVIFPGAEDSIRILRKYGLLAPMAAGAQQEQQ